MIIALRAFRDKLTGQFYNPGDVFESEDKKRNANLQAAGYVQEEDGEPEDDEQEGTDKAAPSKRTGRAPAKEKEAKGDAAAE